MTLEAGWVGRFEKVIMQNGTDQQNKKAAESAAFINNGYNL
ncbi:hypothetical protein N481_01310 [Pseudoalteromonas luteoviolacea S4047-1]|uniref:Uncharacterized protein n=1 Tax=Pseudoalteromonas luteoviolacea S4054 TaxID=1129367 RepID=A0A0F6AGU7_9GAMM|nr:hypothetical protein N479_06200 [Pseudoalteromonas luteoviolacea S4054]KZN70139.1 hypothetical protein N481_01310 [Pseudoalteromonas luteoviolacea S4047-1]